MSFLHICHNFQGWILRPLSIWCPRWLESKDSGFQSSSEFKDSGISGLWYSGNPWIPGISWFRKSCEFQVTENFEFLGIPELLDSEHFPRIPESGNPGFWESQISAIPGTWKFRDSGTSRILEIQRLNGLWESCWYQNYGDPVLLGFPEILRL